MPLDQLLAAVRAEASGCQFPIALLADSVSDEWFDRLCLGMIDDVIPRSSNAMWWRLRIEHVLRSWRDAHYAEQLREAMAQRPVRSSYRRLQPLHIAFPA